MVAAPANWVPFSTGHRTNLAGPSQEWGVEWLPPPLCAPLAHGQAAGRKLQVSRSQLAAVLFVLHHSECRLFGFDFTVWRERLFCRSCSCSCSCSLKLADNRSKDSEPWDRSYLSASMSIAGHIRGQVGGWPAGQSESLPAVRWRPIFSRLQTRGNPADSITSRCVQLVHLFFPTKPNDCKCWLRFGSLDCFV